MFSNPCLGLHGGDTIPPGGSLSIVLDCICKIATAEERQISLPKGNIVDDTFSHSSLECVGHCSEIYAQNWQLSKLDSFTVFVQAAKEDDSGDALCRLGVRRRRLGPASD